MRIIPKYQNLFVSLALWLTAPLLHAQGTTAFTFQGVLNAGTTAANGLYDMTFGVYNANVAGDFIAGPITNTAVAVSNGLFTVTLNFGTGVFTGTNYWVQMALRPSGIGSFSPLSPRQQLTPAPYAISLVSPQANALCPPGSVMAYMGTTAPIGWLMCDGAAISRTNYPALFAVVGTASGAGDGSTTFNLPDMRGIFLRVINASRSDSFADPGDGRISISTGGNTGNAVGSYQADMFASHTHPLVNTPSLSFYSGSGGMGFQPSGEYDGPNHTPSIGVAGGSETRSKNIYVNYIIKY